MAELLESHRVTALVCGEMHSLYIQCSHADWDRVRLARAARVIAPGVPDSFGTVPHTPSAGVV